MKGFLAHQAYSRQKSRVTKAFIMSPSSGPFCSRLSTITPSAAPHGKKYQRKRCGGGGGSSPIMHTGTVTSNLIEPWSEVYSRVTD
ncbi:hypothetical protein RRG08_029649 [Elysia crispata]|uniref:Uncharacterized protein n=1 Tax=Elysia crispata TaxID=231223 RepID=A0AAE1CK12_9GAST|nr:hypothetical protein RRG08_029649 [Elysia crispata]